jgi:zinc transport system substrate-binding protein
VNFNSRHTTALLCSVAFSAILGCSQEPQQQAITPRGKPVVYVVNYPLQYFAERIGGDRIDVRFPVPANEDPAFWRPSGDSIAEIQSADLILLNGASYAKWVKSASLPKSRTVDTSASFHDQLVRMPDAVIHSHGPAGDHSHIGTAFTTWIDFDQARQHALAVRAALIDVVPDHADEITANFNSLTEDLVKLDESMKEVAERIGDQPLVASHPVYQYFARRYALNIKAVHWEPDVVPDDGNIDELEKILVDHPAKLMIWEAQPNPRSIEELKLIGINSFVFDPCGNRPPNEFDWLAVLRENVERLAVEFSQQVSLNSQGRIDRANVQVAFAKKTLVAQKQPRFSQNSRTVFWTLPDQSRTIVRPCFVITTSTQ